MSLIVNRVRTVRISRVDGMWILNEVNLKPNELKNLTGFISNRNHGEKIHERLSPFSVVDQAHLRFRLPRYRVFQVKNRTIVAVLSLYPSFYFSVRRLQKSTVLPSNLVLRISS